MKESPTRPALCHISVGSFRLRFGEFRMGVFCSRYESFDFRRRNRGADSCVLVGSLRPGADDCGKSA